MTNVGGKPYTVDILKWNWHFFPKVMGEKDLETTIWWPAKLPLRTIKYISDMSDLRSFTFGSYKKKSVHTQHPPVIQVSRHEIQGTEIWL